MPLFSRYRPGDDPVHGCGRGGGMGCLAWFFNAGAVELLIRDSQQNSETQQLGDAGIGFSDGVQLSEKSG